MRNCEALRHELDKMGGKDISIDYQLITTNATLKDEQARNELIEGVSSLPIDNVWLRTSVSAQQLLVPVLVISSKRYVGYTKLDGL